MWFANVTERVDEPAVSGAVTFRPDVSMLLADARPAMRSTGSWDFRGS